MVGSRETAPDRIQEIAGVRVDSRTTDRILTDGFRIEKMRNEYCGRSMEVTVRMDVGEILVTEAVFCRPCRVVVVEVVVLIWCHFLYLNCLSNASLLIACLSAMLESEAVLRNNMSFPNTLPLHTDFCTIIPPIHQTRRP